MNSTPGEHRLAIDHLTKTYGGHTVVDDLTFTVEPGRVTGFLGPNGSGKSTTMKILLDLAAADHGTRHDRRLPLPRPAVDPAGTVGVMLEPNAFHPGRSGRNHLRIVAQAIGQPGRAGRRRRSPPSASAPSRLGAASAPTRSA